MKFKIYLALAFLAPWRLKIVNFPLTKGWQKRYKVVRNPVRSRTESGTKWYGNQYDFSREKHYTDKEQHDIIGVFMNNQISLDDFFVTRAKSVMETWAVILAAFFVNTIRLFAHIFIALLN